MDAIKVGQKWKTRGGNVATITNIDEAWSEHPILAKHANDATDRTHDKNGVWGFRGEESHLDLVELISAPEAEKPKFAVGQKWKRRDGETEVISEIAPDPDWPVWSDNDLLFDSNGRYWGGTATSPLDLVELISEPEDIPVMPPEVRETFDRIIDSFDLKQTNPKDLIGARKAPMSTVPAGVLLDLSLALLEGASKYGRHNFRVCGARASIYYDAAMGHLMDWWEGEDIDEDSNLSHVTKAIASLVVLRDAMLQSVLTDDRPPRSKVHKRDFNSMAGEIIDRHADKSPRHYTIDDTPGETS